MMPKLPIEIAEKPAAINCLPGTGAGGGNYASQPASSSVLSISRDWPLINFYAVFHQSILPACLLPR
jgi:hypothetical protein